MTRTDIERKVVEALAVVAPEVDAVSLKPDIALRDQIDLDSMDMLRFVIEVRRLFGVEIAEADYPKLANLTGAIDFLSARVGEPAH
jgi:acyl carrier protein